MGEIIDGYKISKDLKSGDAVHYVSFLMYVQTITSVERVEINEDKKKHTFPLRFFGSVSEIYNRFFSCWTVNSDTDIPVCLQYVKRTQPSLIIDLVPGAPENFVFIKKTTTFKKLKIMKHVGKFAISKSYIPTKGKYISSNYIVDWFLSELQLYKPTIHGPAIQFDQTVSKLYSAKWDIVPYIHFEGWPQVAKEWACRKRPQKWPSISLINEVIGSGYGVVPVGSGQGNSTNLQWRLSFSVSEKLLFQKMFFGKLVFYFLLKKAYRQMSPNCERFKSYHIKMLYFWYMEKVPDMHFYPQNYGQLMINFIDEVLMAIVEKRIHHYFISSVNILQNFSHKECKILYRHFNSHRIQMLETFKNISNWLYTKDDDFSEVIGSTCCSLLPSQSSNICTRNELLSSPYQSLEACGFHYASIKALEQCYYHTRTHFPSLEYTLAFIIYCFINMTDTYSLQRIAKLYIVIIGIAYLEDVKVGKKEFECKLKSDKQISRLMPLLDTYEKGDVFNVREKRFIRQVACHSVYQIPILSARFKICKPENYYEISEKVYLNMQKITELIEQMPFPDQIHFDKTIFLSAIQRPPRFLELQKLHKNLKQHQEVLPIENTKFNEDVFKYFEGAKIQENSFFGLPWIKKGGFD